MSDCDGFLCFLALEFRSAHAAFTRVVHGIAHNRGIVALTPAEQDPASWMSQNESSKVPVAFLKEPCHYSCWKAKGRSL